MSDAEFLGYAGSLAAAGLLFLILAVFGFGQGLVLRALDVLLGLAFLGYAGYLMVAAPDEPFMTWLVFLTPAVGLAVALTARRRARSRLKRMEEEHSSKPYAGQEAAVTSERHPYPSPPAPLDPSAPAPKASRAAASGGPSPGMPSGLPEAPPSGLGQSPAEAAPRPPRPSGLPQLQTPSPAHASDAPPASHAAPSPPPAHASPGSHVSPPSPSHPSAPASPSRASHAEPGMASAAEEERAYRARHGAGAEDTAHHDYTGGRHRADGES
ncbi:hypothetical protein [Paractinoplanes lichenicola]|uniref:Uncharacterized protein n=1 Tax=Paractinoplanes lichenicola TaxID=2802976 RepID=A0ABS1VTD7_9ACTN|nr:hypothetical protein [Actinoplanes lichenicola]MBL7257731.1 hypothetical protein [Actinoplanes lichenicola]